MQIGDDTVQFMPNSTPLVAEPKILPEDFPAICTTWRQPRVSQQVLHYHNCLEIGLCIAGSGVEMINQQLYPFETNSVTIIQSDCVHDSHIFLRSKNETTSTWQYLFVNAELFVGVMRKYGGFLCNDPGLVECFRLMYAELDSRQASYQKAFLHLLSAFIMMADRLAPASMDYQLNEMPPEMACVLKLIYHSYHQDLTVTGLAKECNMSLSSFNRTFKECFGMSPLAFIHQMRLTIALYLLQTSDKPITEIAGDVGYKTLSCFNRLFRKRYGASPRDMRKQAKKNARR